MQILFRSLSCCSIGGFNSEEFLHLQHKYSKSLSWAENLNFLPKTVNNLFKFSAQDSHLEYLCWRRKKFPESSDFKQPLIIELLICFGLDYSSKKLAQIFYPAFSFGFRIFFKKIQFKNRLISLLKNNKKQKEAV